MWKYLYTTYRTFSGRLFETIVQKNRYNSNKYCYCIHRLVVFFLFIDNFFFFGHLEASEIAQAKLKGLDESAPKHNTAPPHPKHNVNSFQNNQVKFAGGATKIPPDQMKCNIFKAKLEEELKKGVYKVSIVHVLPIQILMHVLNTYAWHNVFQKWNLQDLKVKVM